MAYIAITILVLGLSFLLFHRLLGFEMLPQWLRPAKRRETDESPSQNQDVTTVRHSDAGKNDDSIDGDVSLEHETTPKASAANGGLDVPVFSLSGDPTTNEMPAETEEKAPLFPAANSVQRAQATPALEQPTLALPQKNASSLMPPPARPMPRTPPSAASALRVPSTGPLPNRGFPASSQQRVSTGLSPNGTVATPNARGKVLLAPGHSPMDWAALTRKGNLSGVETFQRVTPSTLKSMTGRKGKPAWSSWQGKVYNLTPYVPFHPGGKGEIMRAAGRDGKKLFEEVHPWVNWENMLGTCLVGVMVPEEYGEGESVSSLENID